MNDLLDSKWPIPRKTRKMSIQEWVDYRTYYKTTADYNIIVYSLYHDASVVTNETVKSNDGKPIKKLPAICELEDIQFMDVVAFLKSIGISAKFDNANR